jgi:hypothetical protein
VSGAGVWFSRSANATLRNSILTSPTFFETGVPDADPRHGPGAAATMDLVSAQGTTGTRIVGNTILSGNTAGIYLSADLDARVVGAGRREQRRDEFPPTCSRHRQLRRRGGDGQHDRQCGGRGHLDRRLPRRVLPGQHDLGRRGNVSFYIPRGSLMLNWGSTNNTITGNVVRASHNAEYSVYVASPHPDYGTSARNGFACNDMVSGAMGFFGGELSGKTAPALDRTGRPFRCRP